MGRFEFMCAGRVHRIPEGWAAETLNGAVVVYRIAPDTVKVGGDQGDEHPVVLSTDGQWWSAVDNFAASEVWATEDEARANVR